MSETLIAARDVTFGYEVERPPVLQGVTLELRRSDRTALTGRNGAGKSTLLSLMVGLLVPQSGHVEAFGKACRREEDFVAVRRRVALLFQEADDQLFCPTVLEDVAFGPLNLGRRREQARRAALAALDRVGLPDHADRVPHHLSVGEKKRVALAAVLAMEPDVLLLDEPTAGLDEEGVERIIGALNGLDAALLVVSQDAGFLARVTRKRLTLCNGLLVAA